MNRLKNISWLLFGLTSPVILLLLIECCLRWSGFGVDLDHLFLTTPDGEYLYLNKDISKRYFTASQATTGNPEFFRKKKTEHTFRVFVLGESAALGFPYPNNISFQRMLKYELHKVNPHKEIEIINLSLTAINSYTFYDFAKELPAYQPDAVLIYGGHNEYYGALGVGSTNTFGTNTSVVRFIISLRKTRLVQWIENTIGGLTSNKNNGSDNLMKYVVKDQLIAYNSPIFRGGVKQFERNMTDLLSLLNREKIPVFCSTVATNLKDQYPFRSLLSEQTDTITYNNNLQTACYYLKIGNIQGADSLLTELHDQDATASSAYWLGHLRVIQNQPQEAYTLFNEAKQNDALRFRAPDEINRVIHDLSTRFSNVFLVDSELDFERESPDSIPGFKLLLEHVHPTIEGHRIIARSFLRAMQHQSFFDNRNMRDYTITDSTLTSFPVLEFDSLVGLYSCARLRQGFPFYETGGDTFRIETPIEKLAMNYVREKNWYASMDELYKYALTAKRYDLALEVLRVRMLDNPYDVTFLNQSGDVCTGLRKYKEALWYYRKSFSLVPSFAAAKDIISISLRIDRPDVALLYMDYAASNNESGMDFRSLKALCSKLVVLQKELHQSFSRKLCNEIAQLYTQMGNQEAANLYVHRQPPLQ